MRKFHISVLICLIFCFSNLSQAQQQLSFTSDTIQKGEASNALCVARENEFIYIGGQSFDSLNFYSLSPSIVKTDTSGSIIWTFTINKQMEVEDYFYGGPIHSNSYIDQVIIDQDFLYASCIFFKSGSSYNIREIWKVNKETGNLVWKKSYNVHLDGSITLNVVDNEKLCFGYNSYDNASYIYELIDKGSKKTLFAKTVGPMFVSRNDFFIQHDVDGSTYIVKKDSIFKYNNFLLSTIVWRMGVADDAKITALQLLSDGYCYVFGTTNYTGTSENLFVRKLNKSDGSTTWHSSSGFLQNYLRDKISDYKITDSAIYVSGMHIYTGSIFSGFRVWKLDRFNGSTKWENAYNPNWSWNGTSPSSSGRYMAITSLDVGGDGNVYACGYENGDSRRNGIFSIAKFNGSTGNLIYQKPIHKDIPYDSRYSRGVHAFVLNNRVFYIGNFQKSQNLPSPLFNSTYSQNYLVASDTTSVFNADKKQKITASFQFFSKVVLIKNFSSSKYLLLKQIGKSISVEMRESIGGNMIWSKKIAKSYFTNADQLCVMADKTIVLSAFGHIKGSVLQHDYKKRPDSLYFFKFDSSGTLLDERKYFIGDIQNFTPVQLYASKDTNAIYICARKSSSGDPLSMIFYNVYKAKSSINSLSGNGAIYTALPNSQQVFLPVSEDTSIAVYKRNPSSNTEVVVETYLNGDSTMAYGTRWIKTTVFSLNIRYIHNLNSLDSNHLLVMGSSSGNNAILASYNHRTNTIRWAKTDILGYSIYGATPLKSSIYCSGRRNNDIMIRKINIDDGSVEWEYIKPANAKQQFVPLEQKYNQQTGRYIVSGYIYDSIGYSVLRSPFYIIVDTLGNQTSFWVDEPDLNMDNGLSTIETTEAGKTFLGGAFYKSPFGNAGVFIAPDSISIQNFITNIASFYPQNATSGDTIVIHGKGFLGSTMVKFGSIPALSFTVLSDSVLHAVVSYGQSGDIEVISPTGTGIKSGFLFSTNVNLCPLGSHTLSTYGIGSQYQWQMSQDSVNFSNISNSTLYSGATTKTLYINQVPSSYYGYQYRCLVNGVVASLYTLRFVNTWVGTSSSVWEDPANWSCGALPDANTDVMINGGTILINSNTTIRSLTLQQGAKLTLAPGVILTVTH